MALVTWPETELITIVPTALTGSPVLRFPLVAGFQENEFPRVRVAARPGLSPLFLTVS